MNFTNEILVEDWEGLESETERLLIVYGYPTPNDISTLNQRNLEERRIGIEGSFEDAEFFAA